MKWLYRVSMLLLMVMLSSATYARSEGWNEWLWRYGAGVGDPWNLYTTASYIGVHPGSADGYNSRADILIETESITSAVYAATWHRLDADGWTGPTGFYWVDRHSPAPLQIGQSKTWDVYVWATLGVPETFDTIYAYYSLIMPMMPPDEFDFTLNLVAKPDGITGGPDVGSTWRLSLPSGADVVLPIYRTDNGLTGYHFQLTATMVPEPSNLLTLFGGLGCLAGVLRRRRH